MGSLQQNTALDIQQQNVQWGRQWFTSVKLSAYLSVKTEGMVKMVDVAYWSLCVFQSRWRWHRLFPRDTGLSTPVALPLCYPGSIPACCLWQWGRCLALSCQPNAVRYRWFLCCLHLSCVFPTLSGKSLFFLIHTSSWQVCIFCWDLVFFPLAFNSTFLFCTENSKEIWLHYTCICSLSWGKAPANG